MQLERLQRLAHSGDVAAARELIREAQRREDSALELVAYQAMVEAGEWRTPWDWAVAHAVPTPCDWCGGDPSKVSPGTHTISGVWIEPYCGECKGHGHKPHDVAQVCNIATRIVALSARTIPCPDCDGTGILTHGPFSSPHAICLGMGHLGPHPDNPDEVKATSLLFRLLSLWWPHGWTEWLVTTINGLEAVRPDVTPTGLASNIEKARYIAKMMPEVPECICVGAGVERGRCPHINVSQLHERGHQHELIDQWTHLCLACRGTGKCPRCSGEV